MASGSDKGISAIGDPVLEPAVLDGSVLERIDVTSAAAVSTRVAPLVGCVGKKARTAAVIVAGGRGERLGHAGGKQMMSVLGKPLLTWCLQAFDAVPQVGHIVICCPESRIEEYRRIAVEPYDLVTPVDIVPAGELRQTSAFNGVEAVPSGFDVIAMHDGARPLILPETITHAINTLRGTLDADGVVCGHPAIDTLKVIDGDAVVGTPDRSMFWVAQTPQIFHTDILRQAHLAALEEGFIGTDDSSLVERIGGRVVLVTCPRDNIKLTVPEDVAQVEASLRARYGDPSAWAGSDASACTTAKEA